MRVRDPIHGTIAVSDAEKAIVDSPFFQRLRHIRQLGFGDLAFPGATHTRHAHSLGAMHVSSRLFDAVMQGQELPDKDRQRLRCVVRLAVLCHDLGHMPLSHTSERIAPERRLLGLPSWLGPETAGAQAAHEDFTVKLLLDSPLTPVLRAEYASHGITPEAVAALIAGVAPPGGAGDVFVAGGVDYTPLLRALVSGELDADRMDYLLRDSFYTGVNYGRYDLDWIVHNLNAAVKDQKAYLALSRAAAFAFEDFLLSRYHMFLAVYYHHTTVAYDDMLRRYFEETPGEFEIPADPGAFLYCDDVALAHTLRRSENRWARRIVARQGYKKLAQFTERDEGYDLPQLERALQDARLDTFSVESHGVLSKYFGEGEGPSLYIMDVSSGRLTEVARYTPLYQRYAGAVRLSRIYIRPDQYAEGLALVERLTGGDVA